jgi:hypothetical protein
LHHPELLNDPQLAQHDPVPQSHPGPRHAHAGRQQQVRRVALLRGELHAHLDDLGDARVRSPA